MRRSILLAFAFASLLLIIGGAAFAIWHGSENSRRQVAALHLAHLEAGAALASIRANVYLGGILTRDYLLDSDPSQAARYADQFNDIRNSTEHSFQTLAATGQSPEEMAALNRLHKEVDSYWDPTKIVLDWTPEQKNVHRAEFLQERVRHREEIVELARQVENLMTQNFSRERTRITGADDQFQSWLAWTTGIALLLGVGIAAATVAHMATLERQSEEADAELRRLSGQIRVAQEQERRYLSRELHDQAGQMLTGLRMELASISWDAGEQEFAERVAHAKSVVEQTLRVVRNIAMLLRPSMLDDLGLASAIGWLVREIKRSSGIAIHAEIDPALDSLPDAQSTCVYRVVQEALTNAARHSGASRVDIALGYGSGKVSGAISDDGQGFESSARRRDGLGLIGMEERVRELGGALRLASSPGHGTRIEFRLPGGMTRQKGETPAGAEVAYADRT
jgi:signal transduction histidine kinase